MWTVSSTTADKAVARGFMSQLGVCAVARGFMSQLGVANVLLNVLLLVATRRNRLAPCY
jgi:hypothetical protein